jgi:hypothetical protein
MNTHILTLLIVLYTKEYFLYIKGKEKGKAISVTVLGGPYGCETSRLPYFVDNRLTDGGEVVSLKRLSPFTPQEVSWYSLLLEAR